MTDDEDARQLRLISKAVAEAFEARDRGRPIPMSPSVVAVTEKELRAIVREEIAQDREQLLKDCKRIIHGEVEELFDETLPERFALIGLRIDSPDKQEEARRMFDNLRRAQQTAGEFKKEALSQVVKAFGVWVGIILAGIAAFFGIKGNGH